MFLMSMLVSYPWACFHYQICLQQVFNICITASFTHSLFSLLCTNHTSFLLFLTPLYSQQACTLWLLSLTWAVALFIISCLNYLGNYFGLEGHCYNKTHFTLMIANSQLWMNRITFRVREPKVMFSYFEKACYKKNLHSSKQIIII